MSTSGATADLQHAGEAARAEAGESHGRWRGLASRFTAWCTWDVGVLALAVVVFLALGVALILQHSPLGHDESVYALRGRYFGGGPAIRGFWSDYRAVGFPFLLSVFDAVTRSDAAARGVMLVLGAAGIVVTWLFARAWFGQVAGALAAVVLAVTPWYLAGSFRIYPDVAAATLGLASITAFALAASGERVSWWGLLTAPLAVAATFCRYGAPILILPGLAVVGLVCWPAVRRSLVTTATIALVTAAGVAAVLFVPRVTGSKVAPYTAFESLRAKKDRVRFESIDDLWHAIPKAFGPIVKVVVALGVLALIVQIVLRARDHRSIARHVGVLAILVGAFFALAWSVGQGPPQYLVPLMPFAAIVVAAGFAPLLQRLPILALVALLAFSLAIGSVWTWKKGIQLADTELQSFHVLRQASFDLDRREPGPCLVIASYSPQVGWYTNCRAITYIAWKKPGFIDALRKRIGAVEGLPDDTPVYWFLAEGGKRQPVGELREALENLSTEPAQVLGVPGVGTLQSIEFARMGEIGEFRE